MAEKKNRRLNGIGILIMMLTISWRMTVRAVAVLPLSFVFIKLVVNRSQRYYDRQQAALERVFENYSFRRRPLGARRADKVLVQDFQHAAARQPRDVSRIEKPERQRRQNAVARQVPAGSVNPA